MPKLALTNSLALRQMSDPKTEFGPILVFGTLGWIVAGLASALSAGSHRQPAQIAALASLLMGLYRITLPATPPLAKHSSTTNHGIFHREALGLLKERSMAIFAIASFLICIRLQFYYAFTNLFLNESGVHNAASQMTGGQLSELGCMLLISWFFRRLGVKYMLIAGICAWLFRYIMFAYGNAGPHIWMLWLGILLHGSCYDFFFVTGQIYIDRKASPSLRAAAQGLITFLTYGARMLIGSWLSRAVIQHFTLGEGQHNWRAIWIFSACASAFALALFALSFRDTERESLTSTEPAMLPAEAPF